MMISMTSPIEPIRSGRPFRRTGRATESGSARPEPEIENLPVAVGSSRTIPRPPPPDPEAAFAAHLLGQDGQKRGLRAGPGLIETARQLYNHVEWSGSNDRRARKGRSTTAV
jgi:hypothetical protein